ncbi:MAG TPA: dUTP diphosphatase [Bacteroidales bacterium]|nr:dUTP diphosphatase [Bacteroidales bacterium]HOK73988.1 dUTP diphosphatase [Bacteroidales bacterium]HOM40859.1 dUTP diphosphatase [Bacteroidales bacterium]HPP91811.1 dUTP diphosphatase [Bacteroidales bacterium]HQK70700.1 dUTP diphosphatase [Bacteroidales bacterium]
MKVKIVNKSANKLPEYATSFSAGMDLRAFLEKDIVLKPMERFVVPTGIYIELPEGYEAQIRPRSGMAAERGITVLNTPGTVDADYRGEVKVILINLSDKDVIIKNGERIAQMVISRFEKVEWELTDKLNESTRNKGGFGHTGNE